MTMLFLSGDDIFLTKAKELGDLLLPAFDTASGIPTAQVSFRSRAGVSGWSGNTAILGMFSSYILAHHS